MPLIKGSTLQVYADGTSVDVRDDAAYALGIHDQQLVVRVHPDRPEGARPASAPSVRGRRVRLSCRRGRYSVNADNTLVDELGPDQALAVQLVQVEVRTATVTGTTA